MSDYELITDYSSANDDTPKPYTIWCRFKSVMFRMLLLRDSDIIHYHISASLSRKSMSVNWKYPVFTSKSQLATTLNVTLIMLNNEIYRQHPDGNYLVREQFKKNIICCI